MYTEQINHVNYTRNEWQTVSSFVDMLNFLQNKNINYVADVGSNVGEVSKIFIERIPSIKKIYAYEPESTNYNFLKNRFENEPKIVPIKKGIYYGKTETTLFNNGGSGSHTVVLNNSSVGDFIELTELEKTNIEKLDLIKIDIEGAEYNVIKNSELLKKIKYIIIEFHPFGMDDPNFEINLPPVGIENYIKRTEYIKNYTDNFVKTHLPDHKIVVELDVQYLLELKQ